MLWEQLDALRARDATRLVATLNNQHDTAKDAGLSGLVSEQSIYNLITRTAELEVFPAAQHHGVGFMLWSPLQGGLWGGVLAKEHNGTRRLEGRAAEALVRYRPQIEQYEVYASELSIEPASLALA